MSFERRCSARFSFFRSPTKTRSGAVSFAPPSNNNKKQSVTRDCSPINVATGEEKKQQQLECESLESAALPIHYKGSLLPAVCLSE